MYAMIWSITCKTIRILLTLGIFDSNPQKKVRPGRCSEYTQTGQSMREKSEGEQIINLGSVYMS